MNYRNEIVGKVLGTEKGIKRTHQSVQKSKIPNRTLVRKNFSRSCVVLDSSINNTHNSKVMTFYV